METNINNSQNITKKFSKFSWKATPENLAKQVENYNTLKITQSYRGIAALLILFSLGLTIIGTLVGFVDVASLIGALIIYLPIAYFVYKGHKWAMIAILILWTLDKSIQVFQIHNITPLIWWLIFMPYFYKAYQVELEKKKLVTVPVPMPEKAI